MYFIIIFVALIFKLGMPIIISPRQNSSLKFIPSEYLPRATANRIAPDFVEQYWKYYLILSDDLCLSLSSTKTCWVVK